MTDEKQAAPTMPCPASRTSVPVVFCGLFPVDAAEFEDLRAVSRQASPQRLVSFTFEMESSAALGFGFRCGFLGLLHLEIMQERLEPRVRPGPRSRRPPRSSTSSG
jgi:GTP-binding protein LepA